MEEWIKLSEASERTNIPYSSINRYVKAHIDHLKVKKEYNTYFVHTDSLAVLEDIRVFYQQGLGEVQVDKELTLKGIPVTVNVGKEDVRTLSNTLRTVEDQLLSLHEKSEKQEEFYKLLLAQLQEQQKYREEEDRKREEREKERDNNLMTALRQSLETQKKMAEIKELLEAQKQLASTQEKTWWKFWK